MAPVGRNPIYRLVHMRLGVVADIHGNDVALHAVLRDAVRREVDHWWALGDLVLFGPRPAEVLELLQGLPGISMLRGNTDRSRAKRPFSASMPHPRPTTAWESNPGSLMSNFANC